MQRYGLIGSALSHSSSGAYFSRKFACEGLNDHRYDLFELPTITDLPALIARTPGLRGLNVTIPYKQSVIPFLDGLDPEAAAIGAVNTVSIRNGICTGHNTDAHGFRSILLPALESIRDPASAIKPRAVVLGSGGASRAVAFVLRELRIPFVLVSRDRARGDLSWDMLDPAVVGACRFIINTTPLGMFPEVDRAPPLPYAALTPRHVLIDLVYNPERTVFLERGAEQGAQTIGGLGMLHAQAEAAWAIWQQ